MSACSCPACVRLCAHGSPGWFEPQQIDQAAALMGMTRQEFINRYCVIDYWAGPRGKRTHVVVPAKVGAGGEPIEPTGKRVSYDYAFERGRCALLDESDRCRIHAAKPRECADTHASSCTTVADPKGGSWMREKIVEAWKTRGINIERETA